MLMTCKIACGKTIFVTHCKNNRDKMMLALQSNSCIPALSSTNGNREYIGFELLWKKNFLSYITIPCELSITCLHISLGNLTRLINFNVAGSMQYAKTCTERNSYHTNPSIVFVRNTIKSLLQCNEYAIFFSLKNMHYTVKKFITLFLRLLFTDHINLSPQ